MNVFVKWKQKKTSLVLTRNDNGTVEMSDVLLIFPLKHDFGCRSEGIFLFTCY